MLFNVDDDLVCFCFFSACVLIRRLSRPTLSEDVSQRPLPTVKTRKDRNSRVWSVCGDAREGHN